MKFGTDGVRGVANTELTAEFALRLGRAAARVLGGRRRRTTVVIGGDTRVSTPMLDAALSAGFAAEGVDVRPPRRRPDADGRLRRAAPRSDGGDGLGLAQPVPRQRHQAVRRRRHQAVRRRRSGDRAANSMRCSRPSASPGRIARRSTTSYRRRRTSITSRRSPRPDGAGSLRIVVDAANGAAHRLGARRVRASRRRRDRDRRRTRTAPTSTTPAGRPHPAPWPRRCATTAPISASPSTATPTG